MSADDCILATHEPHLRPRLYALRHPGVLWHFDICAPHDITPRSGWGVIAHEWGEIESLTRSEWDASRAAAAGVLVDHGAAKHSFLSEVLREEICVRLAFALHRDDEASPVSAILRPWKADLAGSWYVGDGSPSDDFLPPLPSTIPCTACVDGTRRYFPRSVDELRDLARQPVHYYHDVVIELGDRGRLFFCNDSEQFTLWHDGSLVADAIRDVTRGLAIELAINDEPLSEHRPHLYASIPQPS